MRRALNIMQACHAAYDTIGEAEIYKRVPKKWVSCLRRLEHRAGKLLLDALQPGHRDLVEGAVVKEEPVVRQVAEAPDG